MATNVFDLTAKLTLDTKDYIKGLDEASQGGNTFSAGLVAGMATAVVAVKALIDVVVQAGKAFAEAVQETAQYGDTVDKQSQKVGMSASAYQKWDYALNLAGTSMQECTVGMKTLTNQIDEARSGSDKATNNFNKLGLSMHDLNSMSREEVFEAVVKGFQNMEDSTERAALANDMFGKSGQNLTPIFNMTNQQLEEAFSNAEKYGMVMSDEDVKASAEFTDAQSTLQRTLEGLRNSIISNFLPALSDMAEGLTKIFSRSDIEGGKEQLRKGLVEFVAVVKEILPDLIDAGIEILKALIEGISDAMPDLIPLMLEVIDIITNALIDNVDFLVDCALRLADAFAKALFNRIAQNIERESGKITEKLRNLGGDGGNAFTNSIANQIDDSPIAQGMIGTLSKAGERLLQADPVYPYVKMIGRNIMDALNTEIGDSGVTVGDTMASSLRDGLSDVGDAFKTVGSGIARGFHEVVDPVVDFGKDVGTLAKALGGSIKSGFSSAVSATKDFGSQIKESMSNARQNLNEFTQDLGSNFRSKVSEAIQGVSNVFNSFASDVSNAMRNATNGFSSVPNALSNMKNAIAGAINSIIEKFQELVEKTKNIGVNVAKGFLEGFQNAWENVKKSVSDGVQAVKNMIEKLFNIHSPSRWARGVANYVGEGFNLGFKESFGDLTPVAEFMDKMEAYSAENWGMNFADLSANASPMSVNVNNLSEQDQKVTVVIEGDASRMFRLMEAQSSKNVRLVGV